MITIYCETKQGNVSVHGFKDGEDAQYFWDNMEFFGLKEARFIDSGTRVGHFIGHRHGVMFSGLDGQEPWFDVVTSLTVEQFEFAILKRFPCLDLDDFSVDTEGSSGFFHSDGNIIGGFAVVTCEETMSK